MQNKTFVFGKDIQLGSFSTFFLLSIFLPPKLIGIRNTMQNVGWREGTFQLHKGQHCRHLWIKSPKDYSLRELVTCSCPSRLFCSCPFLWTLKIMAFSHFLAGMVGLCFLLKQLNSQQLTVDVIYEDCSQARAQQLFRKMYKKPVGNLFQLVQWFTLTCTILWSW